VFRFVHVGDPDDPALVDDFKSDEDAGLRPSAREKRIPELRQGRSVYGSLGAAREVWDGLRQLAERRGEPVRVGYFIAEVVLAPGHDLSLEDLAELDEHLTVWGGAAQLAELAAEIYPADSEGS
jgi:hypothetical protein